MTGRGHCPTGAGGHRAGVLLNALAAAPTTPVPLLERLVDHALTTRPREQGGRDTWRAHADNTALRSALAGNPNVPAATVHRLAAGLPLADGRQAIIGAAMRREGLRADDAIALLGDDDCAAALLTALEHVDDPGGCLVAHAAAHARSSRVWAAVLTHPAATEELRWDAAMSLAAYPDLSGAHAKLVIRAAKDRMAWATTPAQGGDATAWVATLRSAAVTAGTRQPGEPLRRNHQALLDGLTDLRPHGPATVGEPAWYTNPQVPVAEVIAWADAAPVQRWHLVLRERRDPDHALAVAAPLHLPKVANALLANLWHPVRVRQQAAVLLLGARMLGSPYRFGDLLAGGDPDLAARMLHAWPVNEFVHVEHILRRGDLRAEHLDNVAAAAARRQVRDRLTVKLWLATYPTATPEQRTDAVADISEDDIERAAPVFAELVPAARAAATSGGDPATIAAHFPARIGLHDLTSLPGLVRAAGEAVAAWPGLDADQAAVFTALAGDFDGSLAALLATSAVITA